ncbi:hypothetical protein C1Y41_04470 [Pantoea sp. ICBG 1758]|uniref:hypothetical protein n=1 Tax=Pantoea sp. ICBG 1758 TaxID=2071682 RepID=UPI000CE4589D|nr:hypothetical protein [Pantoea sp. ICBG 1758]PPC63904.1 hypothetical protein C1Y41_04470 [Pantoea sp. ICBG 1758]
MSLFGNSKPLDPAKIPDLLNSIDSGDLTSVHRLTSKSGDNFLLVPEEKVKSFFSDFHSAIEDVQNKFQEEISGLLVK